MRRRARSSSKPTTLRWLKHYRLARGRRPAPLRLAKIDILNNTPFTMSVNDAIIKDSKVITQVNGQYKVLNPGNVYFNNAALTAVGANGNAKEIKVVQNALA
ncbi:hypothetical protein LP420_40295 [Massilia sp. B-10]|nr:hypothetical protein LP420_40295 [Massilia sp. B-10]